MSFCLVLLQILTATTRPLISSDPLISAPHLLIWLVLDVNSGLFGILEIPSPSTVGNIVQPRCQRDLLPIHFPYMKSSKVNIQSKSRLIRVSTSNH
ncbi:hypothetical protein P152DRAFT_458312 [Eremomyces bilateralis CBS 781.70]|uniref:Uncharacterized protein n=1 Tax=Eremomyces bilateralis CBS 781.70 TaxID=1392243 RepID=A0A6G1G3A7_9PEZI|nr:uncharacterized protein P152DRAFT_458312 [Eremomyces bilateralis CBS 781.70]KAF1812472.1 hypothetical protein P152DRAFT_458312 [Eremomyces bilateralis CBS 781.70]